MLTTEMLWGYSNAPSIDSLITFAETGIQMDNCTGRFSCGSGRQQSPTFLASGTSFSEDNFSMDQGGIRDGFWMIQVHYIYCALYCYSNDSTDLTGHTSSRPGVWEPLQGGMHICQEFICLCFRPIPFHILV